MSTGCSRQLRRVTRLAGEVGGPESARGAMSEVLHVRGQLTNRRMFVMRKGGEEVRDSREATGLSGEIVVENVEVETGPETTHRERGVLGREQRLEPLAQVVGGKGGRPARAAAPARPAPGVGPRSGRLPGDQDLDPGGRVQSSSRRSSDARRTERTGTSGAGPGVGGDQLVRRGARVTRSRYRFPPFNRGLRPAPRRPPATRRLLEGEGRDGGASGLRRAATWRRRAPYRPGVVTVDVPGGGPALHHPDVAAVDDEVLAGDVGGSVGCEEDDEGSDVLGTEGVELAFLNLGHVAEEVLGHPGAGTRGDGVGGDAVVLELAGETIVSAAMPALAAA